jgi:hypothetical protein
MTGTQCEDFCGLMLGVLARINQVYPEIEDLLELGFLLYYILLGIEEKALELGVRSKAYLFWSRKETRKSLRSSQNVLA